ncbi:MAG: VacJ family lipoprotein [Oceanospirillaceae bacterium]|nr:VacJ family lipoprotein [Oceanospirillaceae bacterium]MCP5351527.1 VacJ family lipoprotein [Oceanospirillaceae bacterium]
MAAAVKEDPWEPFNRSMFQLNENLDYFAAKPLALAYRNATPQKVDDSITNVFSNLGEPFNALNNALQGKFSHAAGDLGRFVVNSTVGLLGIFDVASHIGLAKHNEDFGQTLAYWGVASGPYLVLPVLGPSTVRDTAGFGTETFLWNGIDPLDRSLPDERLAYSTTLVKYLDIRADLVPAEGIISGDKYSFLRSLYLQRRTYLINDGVVEDEFSEDYGDE